MPQLDISSFPSQLFWLAVVFCAMYILMAKAAVPMIASVLQNRRQLVQDDLEAADTLKDKAKSLEDLYEQTVRRTHTEAQTVQATAMDEVKKLAAKRNAELDAEIAKKMERADDRIRAMQQQATSALVPVAGELAVAIATKLAGLKLKKSDGEQAAADIMGADRAA